MILVEFEGHSARCFVLIPFGSVSEAMTPPSKGKIWHIHIPFGLHSLIFKRNGKKTTGFSFSSFLGNSHSPKKAKVASLSVSLPSLDAQVPTQPRPSRNGQSHPRPLSIANTLQPPLLEISHDIPPELQPVFSYLSSHSKKLYTEGYFLRLIDLNPGT